MRGRMRRGLYLAGWMVLGLLVAVPMAGAQAPTTQGPGAQGDLRKRMNEIRAEESDEVKRVPVQVPGAGIDPPPDLSSRGRERAVPPPEPREDRPATLPELPAAQRRALFSTPAYQRRFEELAQCREEVAVIRKAKPSEVAAGILELRWMVARDGNVQGVEVAALSKTDPDVMTCVHRKVSAWRITPSPATPYRATHNVRF